MRVRLYNKKDYDKLRLLLNEFHKETGNNSLKDFYNKNNLKNNYLTLIAEDKRIIGFLIGKQLSNDFIIIDLFINHDYRKKGIAIKLIRTLLSMVNKRILVNPVNKKSLRLFSKLNFKELPDNEKNTTNPPFYTHYLNNNA